MPFLTEVHFQNYHSFLDARCRLSAVTVVIGANNAGKSNFLEGVRLLWCAELNGVHNFRSKAHRLTKSSPRKVEICGVGSVHQPGSPGYAPYEIELSIEADDSAGGFSIQAPPTHQPRNFHSSSNCRSYRPDASVIGLAETDTEKPFVHLNGEGVTRVLQVLSLKHRKQFQKLEDEFRVYVPEVQELTFERADQGKWFIQVVESGLAEAIPLSDLSEGSRIILAILTIIYQPNRPDLILFEDIERDIHPRSLKPLVEAMRRISKEHGVQIIMTTHSPYVLDCFQEKEFWGDVVIVEKTDGVSRLTNADERLVALGYENEMANVPLGDLWYSGALGGVAGWNELWDEPLTENPKS
jgi:predicted ATPase